MSATKKNTMNAISTDAASRQNLRKRAIVESANPNTAALPTAKTPKVCNRPVDRLPATWAGENVRTARLALQGLSWGPQEGGRWTATPADPAAYRGAVRTLAVRTLQEAQIAKAGGRLAQILERLWPNP